ncbi:MAG: transporter ATP-binding protein [Microbacterium sp.]|jgi:putative ABC transport system ATP-binding protein|uniref:ABC transporter ATP-binding protein n=1 Tax=Microbacterium sp. TaxID=51671 RepID=UPI002612BD1E|nr:ABC transporter ATP-binding protein [Microbacterium sp.]MDF2558618.1 transporter ATP-binding protein [Microbacterium sp.]
MQRSSSLIAARAVTRRFESATGEFATVLDGIDIDIAEGDYLALTGPSGSGKTTLLSCLSGLDQPSSGSVRIGDDDLAGLDDRALAHIRRTTLGFVFQRTDLLDELTVLDNILLPAARRRGRPPAEILVQTAQLMDRLGIGELGSRAPHEISGGQRQRVGICRGLVNRPPVLIADEPTGALHQESTEDVLDLFDELNASGTTIIVVTHDPVVAARARSRRHLIDGRMVAPSPALIPTPST